MKNKFMYLTKISLKRKLKTKWFLIANILLAIAIVAVANIDLIIKRFGGDFESKTSIYVIDNTKIAYDVFNSNIKASLTEDDDYNVSLVTNSKDEMIEKLKNDENEKSAIVLIFNDSDENIIDVEMISNDFADTNTTGLINMGLNNTKVYLAVLKYNISEDELASLTSGVAITRTILDESKDSTEESMQAIMTTVFPVFILPFFMLVIFLVQMIGAEVNDEKTTRGMEIIISNVSPKVHFFSKCTAGNLFVIFQALLLVAYLFLALFVRGIFSDTNVSLFAQLMPLLSKLFSTSFIATLKYAIPLIIILMILNFIAYSLLAGILASMTTNTEDFQQIQTPIMLFNLLGYYLAIMAGAFKGALFIKMLGYFPFISAILSPSLFVMGEFGIIDVLISILVTIAIIFVLIRYGLRIYKVGILNYSSGNLWKKMFKALKNN